MYLIFDNLQLRRSSLVNTLLVKRRNWGSASNDIASLIADQLQKAAAAAAAGHGVNDPVIVRL